MYLFTDMFHINLDVADNNFVVQQSLYLKFVISLGGWLSGNAQNRN